MTSKSDKNNNQESWIVWGISIVVCFVVWLVGAWATRWYATHYTLPVVNNAAGLFGDSFGAVNALISAFAFAGVFVTFWLQRKELDLQRQELKAQRDEFAQQNMTLKLQRFENTFFHMMELQQQIVNDLFIPMSNKERVTQQNSRGCTSGEVVVDCSMRGRLVFEFIYYHTQYYERYGVYEELRKKGISGYHNAPYVELLDHYFRHLYTILRYVDETDVFFLNEDGRPDQENEWIKKYHYTTIVRATLSRYELLLLYYNGLSNYGNEKLKPLIEKYSLLNNLDKGSLAVSKEYLDKLTAKNLVKDKEWFKDYQVTGRDYEYYLTEAQDDPSKYNIRAFGCRCEELDNAKESIRKFHTLFAEE